MKNEFPRCKTCNHWNVAPEGSTFVSQPNIGEANHESPWVWQNLNDRRHNPKICGRLGHIDAFSDKLVDRGSAGVIDHEAFDAALMTDESFGCVKHSSLE